MFNALLAQVAPPPAPTATDAMVQLATLVLLFAGMYFLVIVPGNQKAKAHAKLLKELAKGDEVATLGGIYGTIVAIKGERVTLRIADKVEVEVQLSAIGAKVEKETK